MPAESDYEVQPGRYMLNIDGGMSSDGHRERDEPPGPAAVGGVLCDHKDRLVMSFQGEIGPETIQGAEYRALSDGLALALDMGIRRIRAFVDNQLVVDQINGVARAEDESLIRYLQEVSRLLEQFDDQRVYWVPRERNSEADELVRRALPPTV